MGESYANLNNTRMDIPSLPAGMAGIVAMANADSASAEDVAHAVMLDPALSSKVLRMANSAFYGRLARTETVTEAVVTLGFNAVRTIALAASVVDHMMPEESIPGLNWRAFWQHCVATGAASELISRCYKGGKKGTETGFVAGLLHDVGKLVIARNSPAAYSEVVHYARQRGLSMVEAERVVLGTDHGEVGAMLAGNWRIPASIGEPMGNHHDLPDSEDIPLYIRCVKGGNLLAQVVYGGYLVNVKPRVTMDDVSKAARLDKRTLEEVKGKLHRRVTECAEVLNWGSSLPGSGGLRAA